MVSDVIKIVGTRGEEIYVRLSLFVCAVKVASSSNGGEVTYDVSFADRHTFNVSCRRFEWIKSKLGITE